MVKVQVPASTANIGPGFDTLGLALKLYNIYFFEELQEGLIIDGCPQKFKNENNLVYKAFKITADKIGFKIKGLKITMETDIPVSRGLGSSAACVVGGVLGANALAGNILSKEELFNIAVEIEGHPDNIAPAMFGGLTASLMLESKPYYVKHEINKDLKLCALIPEFEVNTSEARKVLPCKVDYKEAVHNISRTAVLLKALQTGNEEMIKLSIDDLLHQPYRKLLIYEYDKVSEICKNNDSLAVFISGAGPTIMNIVKNSNFTKLIQNDIINLAYKWNAKMLKTDFDGAVVTGGYNDKEVPYSKQKNTPRGI